jgi:small-conductance mechanosensitive channel
MTNDSTLQLIWEELETVWLFLLRPVVHLQLLAIGLAILAGWILSRGLRRWSRHYFYAWVNRWPDKKAQWYGHALGTIIEIADFPAVTLAILPLVIAIYQAQGMLTALISRAIVFFWILLSYRIFIAGLHIFWGRQEVQPYLSRLLAPVFWISVTFWLTNTMINLPILAEINLFTLSGENSFTLGKLFWTAFVLYFLFTMAWVIQNIVLKFIVPRTTIEPGAINAALTIGRYIVLLLGVIIVFTEIGFDPTSLALIGGGLSVGIGFGLQSIISNFISGIVLLFEQSLRPGDVVQVGGVIGTVDRLGIRSTIVRTYDNVSMIIPNETFFTSTVTTYTHDNRITRLILTIGAGYNSDPKEVMEVLLQAAEEHGLVMKDPAPTVFFENYGVSSIDFHLAIWLEDPSYRKRVPSDLRLMIWKEFARRGIEIPFPQQDIHIRSGIPWDKLAASPSGETPPAADTPSSNG